MKKVLITAVIVIIVISVIVPYGVTWVLAKLRVPYCRRLINDMTT